MPCCPAMLLLSSVFINHAFLWQINDDDDDDNWPKPCSSCNGLRVAYRKLQPMKVMTYLSLTMMIHQLYEAQAKTTSRCLSCCCRDIAAVSDADESLVLNTDSELTGRAAVDVNIISFRSIAAHYIASSLHAHCRSSATDARNNELCLDN